MEHNILEKIYKKQNSYRGTFRTKGGFTLIETLVAVSILSSVLVAMIVITAGGLANGSYVKNKLTAISLAQEALEIIHNDRDTNMVSGAQDWDTFTTVVNNLCGKPSSNCTVEFNRANASAQDPTKPVFKYKKCSTCAPLNLSASGFYGYAVGDPVSIFTRTVHTSVVQIPLTSDTEMIVTVTVTWMQGTSVKSVSLTEALMDWVPGIVAFRDNALNHITNRSLA